MPELNPNIILAGTPDPQPFDPLGMVGKVQAIQNARAQNALLQNSNVEFQQKQAAGQAYARRLAQNTDASGNTNFNGLLAGLAQDAQGNPAIADAITTVQAQQGKGLANTGQGLTNQVTGQQLTQEQARTAHAHFGVMSAITAPLLAKPNLSVQDVSKAVADAVGSEGLHPDANLAREGASFIAALGPNPTPDAITTALKGVQLQAADGQARLEAAYPSLAPVQTGAATEFVQGNRFTGTVAPATGSAAVIRNELSPGERIGRVSGVDPRTGVTETRPIADLADSHGNPTPTGHAVQTSLAPGQNETMVANAGRLQVIQSSGLATAPRLAAMQNVRTVVDHAPATAFGPTGDITSRIGKLATAFGVAPPAVKDGQTALDELNKSLENIAAQQSQAMGAGTDASRATVHNANPSLANSREGLKANLAVVQGNDEWLSARNAAAQQWAKSHPASDIAQFETAWNQKVSPLVFQAQHMTTAQQKQLFNSLPGARNKDGSYDGQKGNFLRALDYAHSQGWLGQ